MSVARIADKRRLAGAPALSRQPDASIVLPRLLEAIYEQRPDLAKKFDLTVSEGRSGYLAWCLTEGRNEYKAFTEMARAGAFECLNDPDPSCQVDEPTPLTGLIRLAWQLREDVQESFRLPDAAEDLVWWFFLHGARELGFDDFVGAPARADLNRSMLPAHGSECPPFTPLMAHLWHVRPDLQLAFDLRQSESRSRFARWFLCVGAPEHDLEWLIGPDQLNWLRAPWWEAPELGLSNEMGERWRADPELRERFDLAVREGVAGFINWWRTNRSECRPTKRNHSMPAPIEEPREGADLVGYARGELGIGEDVRMISQALSLVGVPHAAINVPPDPSVRVEDRRLDDRLTDRPSHRAVVFAMTGTETVRVMAMRGFAETQGRYLIGHWPWELPSWPARWEGAYDLVDEIWTISRYVQDAFADRAPVPVVVMPPAVALPADYRRWVRADFNLPETAFLFHFSFDFLSYPHRKNPWACVEAFQRAFPLRSEPVGLVVKSMRGEKSKQAWRRLREISQNDRRIILIDRTMSRSEIIGLMACTDAYLSLHRAEGFGRGLAEAMLLGRPVIATDHSGSTDFITEQTGFPVSYRLVPIRRGQYPGGEGQRWADPSLDHAAEQMRRVYEDADTAVQRARSGQRFASELFSPEAAGARYRDRLMALGLVADGR